jgi:hypothetical protein
VTTPTLALPPAIVSTVHVAAPPPGTVAVNCWVWPIVSAALVGAMLMAAAVTVTVAVAAGLVPPGPAQVSEYVVVAVSAPVLWVPLVASVPVQPPVAVHAVALVELQVRMDAPLGPTMVGFAVSVAVGAGLMVTVAVAAGLVPVGPVQVNEYVVFAVGLTFCVPLVAKVPLHPPEAVHAVALLEVQVSVDVPPAGIAVGDAVSVAVGMAVALMVTVAEAVALVPPGPTQYREYVVAVVSAPVLRVPAVIKVPLQPLVAMQDVALVELQVKVALPPLATAVGDTVNATVGTGRIVTAAIATLLVPPGPVQVSE